MTTAMTPAIFKQLTYSVKELCEVLGLSDKSIYTAVQKNQIPHVKVGGKILFSRAKIEQWLNAGNDIPKSEL